MSEVNPEFQLPKWKIWYLAARPKTLWAGATPVIIGGALAFETGHFHFFSFLAALAGSVFIQIGANFSNDLFDFVKKTDTVERVGPTRVTQAGLASQWEMTVATIIIFLLAALVGLYLIFRGGWPVFIIGATSIIFALLYTGGPIPLGYIGLGELFVLIYYGPVAVAGTFYVITLNFSLNSVLAGISPGLISTAILTVNNLRDIHSDRRSGKKTLAVRFGDAFAKFEYLVLILAACLFPIVIYLIDGKHPWILLACPVLVAFLPSIRKVFTLEGTALNQVLAQTGKSLALFGLLFSVGWLI